MGQSRRIYQTITFQNEVKRLAKKHRGADLTLVVSKFLETLASSSAPLGDLIPGLDSAAVFKVRIAGGGMGARGAFRVIYFRDPEFVLALFIYQKGELEDVRPKEIRTALENALKAPQLTKPDATGSEAEIFNDEET
jgi:hypothetical protein